MNVRIMAVGVLLLACGTANAADDAITIIDKAIKAQGGVDKMAKAKGQQWQVNGIMHFMEMKLPYTANYTFSAPNQFRFNMKAEFGGQKIEMQAGTDGKTTWQSMGAMVEEMPEKKAKALNHNIYGMYLSLLLPLKEKEYTLSVTGEEKVNDKPAVGIKVTAKNKPDFVLYFDKAIGLIVKTSSETWDEFTDKVVPQEVYFVDYKEKDGEKVFNKLLIKRSGKDLLEEEITGSKLLDTVDAKLFAKPK